MIEIDEINEERYNILREKKSVGFFHYSTNHKKWFLDMNSGTELDMEELEVIAKQIEEINGKV